MAEYIKLGSLYLDGKATKSPAVRKRRKISIGNTVGGKEIEWVKTKNFYVARSAICHDSGWRELDKTGLIFGTVIKIDGHDYLCRSLIVGCEEGVPNEWDQVLDEVGEDDAIWNWSEDPFWGQDTTSQNRHVYRGFKAARGWGSTLEILSDIVGFRPVLEPITDGLEISDVQVGERIKVFGPTGSVIGNLLEITDYDALIGNGISSGLDNSAWCFTQSDDTVIVDKNAIIGIWQPRSRKVIGIER